MKLALLGYPISHSLSPKLYQDILGDRLTQYDLLAYPSANLIPSLDELAKKYDGINITTPYKTHFIQDVSFDSEVVQKLGAINVIKFGSGKPQASNTDAMAVEIILKQYLKSHPQLKLVILGAGVMGRVTKLLAQKLSIPFEPFSRKVNGELNRLDLSTIPDPHNTLVINACSRDFVFQGKLHPLSLFWDYNYKFDPHLLTIPQLVSSYQDGQEMLRLQAQAAVAFWQESPSKHNC